MLLTLVGIAALVITTQAIVLPTHRLERARWAALRAAAAARSARALPTLAAPFPWLEPGDADSTAVALDPTTALRATRIASSLALVVVQATGTATGQGSPTTADATGLALAQRRPTAVLPRAALIAGDTVALDSGTVITATGGTPAPWSSCTDDPPTAALRLAPTSTLLGDANAQVSGAPIIGDAVATPTRDSIDRVTLAARTHAQHRTSDPRVRPAPVAMAGQCVMAPTQWGEPQRHAAARWPCRGYAPTVVVTPAGGTWYVDAPASAQGLLVVDGNVVLQAPLTHTGVLRVTGQLDARAAPLVVLGALLVDGPVRLGASSRITYSACAHDGAQLAAAPLTPVGAGGWIVP